MEPKQLSMFAVHISRLFQGFKKWTGFCRVLKVEPDGIGHRVHRLLRLTFVMMLGITILFHLPYWTCPQDAHARGFRVGKVSIHPAGNRVP